MESENDIQVPVGIGFPKSMKQMIEELAVKEGRTFAGQVRWMVQEGLKARGIEYP